MRSFADIILTVRYYKGWSMDQLATRLGVTKSYIQMLERGDRILSFKLFSKLAKVTDIPFSFMMVLADYDTLCNNYPNLLKCLLEENDMLESLVTLLLYCDYTTGSKSSVDNFRNFNLVVREKIYG